MVNTSFKSIRLFGGTLKRVWCSVSNLSRRRHVWQDLDAILGELGIEVPEPLSQRVTSQNLKHVGFSYP